MSKLASNRVVDSHATNLVSGFRRPNLVAVNKIWPIVPVTTEAGKFMEFAADVSVIRRNLERALGDDRKRVDIRVGSGSYKTGEYGIEVPIFDRELKNVPAARQQDYYDKKAELAAGIQLLAMEYTAAELMRTAGTYDSSMTDALTSTDQWKDSASTPYADLRLWLNTLSAAIGIPVSMLSLAVALKPWQALQDHADTLDRVKYTGRDATPQWLANALSCKSVDLLTGMYASSFDPDDPKAVSFSQIFDDEIIAYYEIPGQPSAADPLWGAVCRVDGYPIVTEYRDEPKSADIVAVDDNWGVMVHSDKRGFLARTVSGN